MEFVDAVTVNVEIRYAVGNDVVSICNLIKSLAHHRTLDMSESASDSFLAGFSPEVIGSHLSNPSYGYLVAVVDGSVAGVLGIRNGNSIIHLFVSERYQRLGIARGLWEWAKRDSLVSADASTVSVRSSIAAVPVYERFGFVATGAMVHEPGVMYVPMVLARKLK